MSTRRTFPIVALVACLATNMWLGCGGDYEGDSKLVAPSSKDFVYVSEALDYSCGTLDCHGKVGRNLKLYGTFGLRLDPKDAPCKQLSSAAEVEANYRAAVALEPDELAEVVSDEGADPERLTLIRKARGTESHKGGVVFPKGSFGDLCLVSWLRGKVDQPSCNNLFSHLSNSLTVCKQATQP